MHQKSLPPRGKALFCLISWLPLGGKLSTKLTDEGQLQYRLNSFLQKTSCSPHPLALQGASPSGEAYIFVLFPAFPWRGSLYFRLISWLPLGGKLSTKLTDEGQLQYRLNSFLQKTSCPPHHLASQGASPEGEAYIFFALFSWLTPRGKAYICGGGENRGLFFIFSPLFSQSF